MQKLKLISAIIIALACFGLGYFVTKPIELRQDPVAQQKIEEYKRESEAAKNEASRLLIVQSKLEDARRAAEEARKVDRAALVALKAKVEALPKPVGTPDSKDEYIARLEDYTDKLEKDKEGLVVEVDTLKRANTKLLESETALQKSFDNYRTSKEIQISTLQASARKGKLKAFAWGVGTGLALDRGISLAFKLRF